MAELILILVSAIFVNNFVLARFLGICPFMGVSKKVETALGMGMAVTFVMTVATVVTWFIQYFVLIPFGIEYLQTIAFILVIASLVQLVEMVVQKVEPGAVPVARYFPAADHHQLRGSRPCGAQYPERIRLSRRGSCSPSAPRSVLPWR